MLSVWVIPPNSRMFPYLDNRFPFGRISLNFQQYYVSPNSMNDHSFQLTPRPR